jgi:N-acetyl-gamma-glutamyl-phosphate reductase
MHKVPVGVLGASGYAGRELCGLIARHPGLELAFASANEQRGKSVTIAGRDVTYVATEDARLSDAEVVFTALPHGASAQWVDSARSAGARVVDLSSDFRPGADASNRAEVPYGLTELMRAQIPDAQVVANPGCYPTAVLLAIAPLLTGGWVLPNATINVSAASGVTGAGYSPRPDLLFAEVAEDFRAYSVGNNHRHVAEMQAVTMELGGCNNDILFTPHLLPVSRGILATITVPTIEECADDILSLWKECYSGEPFIEVTSEPPTLRDVVRRNVVRISVTRASNVRQPTLIIISAIDNLIKGAAGQAIQNANVLLGLSEPTGLPA